MTYKKCPDRVKDRTKNIPATQVKTNERITFRRIENKGDTILGESPCGDKIAEEV